MRPDFAEQARYASVTRDDDMPDTRAPIPEPPPSPLYFVTALIVAVALTAVFLALSMPCDHEFWGGIKVGLGAVCQ